MKYDPNNERQSLEIVESWHHLMKNKEMQVWKVYQRVLKEEFSAEQLKIPIIAQNIERFGYYDIARLLWGEQTLDVLDFFVELGYVSKFVDNIHQISYHHVVHPYAPFITPSGGVGISGPSNTTFKIIALNSKRYSNFVNTARDFKNQLNSGKHPHITEFNFGENFSYQSDVYEVKDRYFDALGIGYSSTRRTLTVYLTEPETITHNNIVSKHWKRIKQLDLNLFLSGNQAIDSFIEELEWKKKCIGIMIYDNIPYAKLYEPPDKEEDDDDNEYLAMPDFLGEGVYSIANILSNKFEDVTADYLNNYLTKTGDYFTISKRLKPSYLHGKEVDIVAEQRTRENVFKIICECKLRLENSPITENELDEFNEKVLAIMEYDSKSQPNNTSEAWLVTNSDNVSDGAKSYALTHNIKIKKVDLSRNWSRRADWKITRLYDLNQP